jgi:translation initiation factor 2D
MFKKSAAFKNAAAIRGKEIKKLKADVVTSFGVADVDVDALIPPKADVACARLAVGGGKTLLYLVDKVPMFVDCGRGHGGLFPTVFALWLVPSMLPALVTWAPVSTKLCGGADLMLPGVCGYVPSGGTGGEGGEGGGGGKGAKKGSSPPSSSGSGTASASGAASAGMTKGISYWLVDWRQLRLDLTLLLLLLQVATCQF